MRPLSPAARCALTAPFHPCLCRRPEERPAIGGLLSVALSVASAPKRSGSRALPGTLPCGARTFLRRNHRSGPTATLTSHTIHTDSDEKSGATGAGSPIVISVEKLKLMECTHKRGVGHATAVGRKLRWAPPPFQPPAHTGCWCLTQQTQQQEHGRREPNSLVRHRLLAQPNPPAPNCHPDEQLLTRTLAGQRA